MQDHHLPGANVDTWLNQSSVQHPYDRLPQPPRHSTINTSPVHYAHDAPSHDTRFYTYDEMVQHTLIQCSPDYTLIGPNVDLRTWNPNFETWVEFIRRTPHLNTPMSTLPILPTPGSLHTQPYIHRYPYTSSKGITMGPHRDPNVLVAYEHCPLLQCGSHCLDPYYNRPHNIRNLPFGKMPYWGQRAARRVHYKLTERLFGPKGDRTAIQQDQARIPKEWQLCYYTHRDQRILAKDPLLSIMENFILRMVKSQQYEDSVWNTSPRATIWDTPTPALLTSTQWMALNQSTSSGSRPSTSTGTSSTDPPPYSYNAAMTPQDDLDVFNQPRWPPRYAPAPEAVEDIPLPPPRFNPTVTSTPITIPRRMTPAYDPPTPTVAPPWRRPPLHTLDLTHNDRLLLNMLPDDSL